MDMLQDNEEAMLEMRGCLLTKETHGIHLEHNLWRVYADGQLRVSSSIGPYALAHFSSYVGRRA